MLKLITLHTIDRIFQGVSSPLGAMEKMLYLNCLVHHFRPLEATESNAVAFDIAKSEIPNFVSYERQFLELEKAGLVEVLPFTIHFINHWGATIDRTQLGKSKSGFLGDLPVENAEQLKKELLENDYMYEMLAMKHRLNRNEYNKLIDMFIAEQMAVSKKYYNMNDCLKHLMFWIPLQKNRMPNEKKSIKILGEQ